MYLHIGGEISIPLKEIIAIIDLDSVQSALATQELLELAQGEKRVVIPPGENEPKSCIITDTLLYLSTISAVTLFRRARNFGVKYES